MQAAIATSAQAPAARAQRLSELSRSYQRGGDIATAIFWAKHELQIDQATPETAAQRTNAPTSERLDAHHRLASLLLQAGRIDEAQQVLQMAKEQELHDSALPSALDDPRISALPLTAAENELSNLTEQLDREQRAVHRARDRVLERRAGRPDDSAQVSALTSQLAAGESRQLALFISIENQLRGTSPTVPVAAPSRLERSINDLAQREPSARAVALQYVIQDDGVWILVLHPNGTPLRRFVPIDRKMLEARVHTLRLQVREASSRIDLLQATARGLHQLLVAPVQDDLQRLGARTLMLSVTGVLRYVPFAALHDGSRYLVEDYALSFYNEAVDQRMNHGGATRWRIAALGLSQPVDNMRPLVAVPEEMRGVISQPNIEGEAYLDADFDLPRLQAVLRNIEPSYNVLHVASHFVLEPSRAANSRLYLGDGGRLTLTDLTTGRWRFDHLDLLTLSACETATPGQRDVLTGQEVESLGASAQQQGAQAVLATLWKVNDRSTAAFMQDFYRLLGGVRNKASSLREAQRAFLGLLATPGSVRPAAWAHPFHWASFVLMGNWR